MNVVPLGAANVAAFCGLFEESGCACYCRYWHFQGTKADWLARVSAEPTRNREEQVAAILRGDPEAQGLLALAQEVSSVGAADRGAVGWLKLAPRTALPKLLRLGAYRRFDAEETGTWSIGCLLVRPDRRRLGVARALVQAADGFVRAQGGLALEAYPRRADHPLYDEEAFMGTVPLFESCGFVEVAGEGPYPILRKKLDALAA